MQNRVLKLVSLHLEQGGRLELVKRADCRSVCVDKEWQKRLPEGFVAEILLALKITRSTQDSLPGWKSAQDF